MDYASWHFYHSHAFPDSKFLIINNDSSIKLPCENDDIQIDLHGFPNQHQLYGDIINGKYGRMFNDGDYLVFIDDDEFLYYHDPNDKEKDVKFKDIIDIGFKKYDVLAIPHINMSSKKFYHNRNFNKGLPLEYLYRRHDEATTVKCIVKYDSCKHYDFNTKSDDIIGHVPFINGKKNAAVFTGWRDVETGNPMFLGFDIGGRSFAHIDYSSNVRLYHYHIKSEIDWEHKIARGSCASIIPWYDYDISKNIFFGEYETLDESMSHEYKRITRMSSKMEE